MAFDPGRVPISSDLPSDALFAKFDQFDASPPYCQQQGTSRKAQRYQCECDHGPMSGQRRGNMACSANALGTSLVSFHGLASIGQRDEGKGQRAGRTKWGPGPDRGRATPLTDAPLLSSTKFDVRPD